MILRHIVSASAASRGAERGGGEADGRIRGKPVVSRCFWKALARRTRSLIYLTADAQRSGAARDTLAQSRRVRRSFPARSQPNLNLNPLPLPSRHPTIPGGSATLCGLVFSVCAPPEQHNRNVFSAPRPRHSRRATNGALHSVIVRYPQCQDVGHCSPRWRYCPHAVRLL